MVLAIKGKSLGMLGRQAMDSMRLGLKGAVVCLAALVLGSSPTFANDAIAAPDGVFETMHHKFRVETVVTGLEDPWSLAFLPNGDLLITEKPGRLRLVREGALRPEPVPGTPEVWYRGQGGLLEVALHPEFAENRYIYLTYSKPNEAGDEATTALARGRLVDDELIDLRDILVAEAWSRAGQHFGSKLAFDEAGHLFMTIGDRGANPFWDPRSSHPAQQLDSHIGKTLRLRDDGSVPDDNPFVGQEGALPEIWSYGHRNAQGLVYDAEHGRLWLTEHGPQGGDELNLVEKGRNYGWPVIGYGVQYGGQPIHEATHREGMEQPVQYWTPSIATSGLALYQGDVFPEWRGNLLVGGLAGRQVARVPVAERGGGIQIGIMERPGLLSGWARIRDVRVSPAGYVYLVTDDRRGGGTTPVVRLVNADD
jgi:aldose sugar dehydrogenase